jgi:hypothetical protein
MIKIVNVSKNRRNEKKCNFCGWMDGWMDGWIDRWVGVSKTWDQSCNNSQGLCEKVPKMPFSLNEKNTILFKV